MTQNPVIDSHTAGEPTRVILSGGPLLGDGPLKERLHRFRTEFDSFRTATVTEPRGSDVLVGALLCEPMDPTCSIGVIFFNNVGYLGMCGHGMIGVVETLRHLDRISSAECRIETPVGMTTARRNDDASVAFENVISYRAAKDVAIQVEGVGRIVGDVAWGGNWFYLVTQSPSELSLANVAWLQQFASRIRTAINAAGFPEVDHVELFGPPTRKGSDSRNFVLCPGMEYDRSPCGTGTSAKLACLAADEKIAPGEMWTQELEF